MFSLHKKKRIVLSALVTMAIILPAVVFAANRLMVVDDTHAITYEMPEGYTAMVDPNFYDCVVATYKSTYPAAIIPETGITDEQLSTIDQLVCNSRVDGEKIVDTTGLEKMPRMAYLDLSSNNISAIDVSDFNLLSYLNLHSNRLNAINVSNNSALKNLYLNNNNISTINLTHNPELKEIDISNNRLDSINLSNNVKLVYAKLHANQLSSIDVSNNTALRLLNINDNNIPLIDISNNTNLNDFMADDIIVFYTGINPTISNGNFIYDMSGLNFLKDGDHEGFIVDFSIANTENYSYDEANMILTVNNPEGAGRYIQVSGVDDRNEGSFTYKLGLPYVLRYDLNGGSGNFGPAVCYPSISTQTCTIDIADGSPVLTDYNFIGWADTDDATAGEYGAGDTISLSDNHTIYAVWKSDITTVNLNFDLNDGEGDISAQSCSFTSANPNCTVTIPNVTPTRAGYNFLGWANSDTATVADYQQGGSMSLSQDKTVYAVWELITNTVSLSFNLNGGEGDVATQTCTVDINNPTCDATIPSVEPTRNGYNFIGWAESDTATSAAYNSGDNVTINSNKTLYAVWQIITTTISLSFDLNGGEGDVATQTCTIDIIHPNCTVTIPNTTPTRVGYNFLGWANSDTATVAVYQSGNSISLSQDKTVYAVWEMIITPIELIFDLNGGEGEIATQTCTIDINHATCDVIIPGVEPTRNGYNFIGWAENDTATTAAHNPGDNVTLNNNKTLYAVWQIISTTINLNFDLNGGEGDVANQTCTIDIVHPNCTVTIPNVTPTRAGYNFLGWANSDTATVAVYQPGGSISLSQDKTVYAVWELIVTTTKLIFDLNGGEGEVATQTCTLDIDHVTCDVTIPATVPTRNGYNFMGWAESDAATEPTYHEGDSLTINNDKTIFAVWDMVNTTITLNYDLNGGEGEIAAETCVVNVTNPTCEIAISDVIPTKEDHEFLGWADSASATEAVYASEDEITINADKTLYAVWKNTRDEEPDDSETPVPDTSAPDTGVNTNNGVDAVIAISLLPVLVGIIYIANVSIKKRVKD